MVQVVKATKQVAQAGTPGQIKAVGEILSDTRRKIYLVLAEGDPPSRPTGRPDRPSGGVLPRPAGHGQVHDDTAPSGRRVATWGRTDPRRPPPCYRRGTVRRGGTVSDPPTPRPTTGSATRPRRLPAGA